MSACNCAWFRSLFCVKQVWLTMRRGRTAGCHCRVDIFLDGQAKLVTGGPVIHHGKEGIGCGTGTVEY